MWCSSPAGTPCSTGPPPTSCSRPRWTGACRCIAAGVFNSGLLAAPAPGATYDYQAAPGSLIARARRLEAVCARFGVPLRAAAARFPLAHPAVASVLIGARSAAEISDAIRLRELDIPAAAVGRPGRRGRPRMRIALHTRIRAGRIEEYERAHAAVPPELTEAIRAAGRDRLDDLAQRHRPVPPDRLRGLPGRARQLARQPVNVAWQERMAELLETVHDYTAGGGDAVLPAVWRL